MAALCRRWRSQAGPEIRYHIAPLRDLHSRGLILGFPGFGCIDRAIRSLGVNRLLVKVAEEGDRIMFEIRPVTVGTRFVVEVDPEEWLVPDVGAYMPFEDVLLVTNLGALTVDARPAIVPVGVVVVEVVFRDDCLADAFALHGASVCAPCGWLELPLPIP